MSGASKLAWVGVLLLLQVGCAYSQNMRKGEKLSATGDWAGAFAAYTVAADKKPDDPEAARLRDLARDNLVEDELTNARASIDTGNYEAARTSLDRVAELDRDHPEVFELTGDLERTLAAHYDRLWQQNDPRGAYELVIRTKNVLPKAQHLGAAFDRVRAWYTDEAERLLVAKEHEKALAALKTITDFEPDRKANVAPTEQRIRLAWADHLDTRAATLARQGKVGAGTVLFARAYEVAGRMTDLQQARDLAAKIALQGRFSVQLDVTGPAARVTALKEGLAAGIVGVPNSVVVPSDAVLGVRTTLEPQKCTEVDTVTPATLDYVSGQIEKPNPVHIELTALLAAARQDEATAKARSEALFPQLEGAKAALQKFDAAMAIVDKEKATATAALEAAQTQLTSTRTRRDEMEAQLDGLVSSGGAPATVAALEAQIIEVEKLMNQWTSQVVTHEGAETTAETKVAAMAAERSPAAEAVDRLQTGNAAAVQDRTAASQLGSELSAKLSGTPKTVWEDVHELLKYDVHDWKRTCVAPASVALRARWKTDLGTARKFAPSSVVEDRAHIGHVKAKLEADPKAYPVSDSELVAKADAETLKAMLEWLSSMADDAYRDRVMATLSSIESSPVDATTAVLALYLGARGRLDEPTLIRFTKHLSSEYGLEKPELLNAASGEASK